ncbi:protein SUPPRESSOR OF GENE SILENCING 3 homolog [Euphorbia lathyris]|uniref:protein SUPPRESSOR OF GENE SILENCING 3 homolog n=1 Tax=Euphorbia lathyris TaxID=212925 RepID=UPI003313CC07
MAISSHLLPLTDTHFFNQVKEDEHELQQFLDSTFAEKLQLEEALKACLFTSQIPVEMTAESSLSFCDFCKERKENHHLKMSGKCAHSLCFDCSNLKKGICPLLNCDYAHKSDTFKQFLPKDLVFLWEKAPSTNPISNFNCREESHAKMDAKSTRLIIPRGKYKEAIASGVSNQNMDRRKNKGPKQVYKRVKNTPPLVTSSSAWEDEWPAFSAAAYVDDSNNSDKWPDTDDYDSNASPISPERCRTSKWFEKFDRELEFLINQGEMNDPARHWYCPACQGSPHASKQYVGLQTLTQHVNRKHLTRVRLHQELAQLLVERLKSESASSNPAAKPRPKWKGLEEDKGDDEIVWPPMVVISYTMHTMDENDKGIGMNQEVMKMFSSYDAIVKAEQCYNMDGHCGMSVLVFESSVMGYLEAERLHKHFVAQGSDRNAWDAKSVYFVSSEEQQLYGYLALKKDVDIFNNHMSVKHQLKYEMRSYKETVVKGVKQMCEDKDEVVWLRNRVAEQEKEAKESEECYGILKEKLKIAKKELDVMRCKVKEQHEQHMGEVECQEQFYKEQIRNILESRKENDGDLDEYEYIREEITKPIKNEGRSNTRCMLAMACNVRERLRLGLL